MSSLDMPSEKFEISVSRQLTSWMHDEKLSFGLSTYQIGKLMLLGCNPEKGLSVFERTFGRCMGMVRSEDGFYLSSLYQIWKFQNSLPQGQSHQGYDKVYVPQNGNTTGDLDVHDLGITADGQLVFVNTLFGCLATLSDTHSFKPYWKPPFISRLAAEDRCHLNGLAMQNGEPAFVTIVGQSDILDGWRQHRVGGGLVMDVRTNKVVADGLSMPHSPRWYNDRLWLLNSGTGEFGYIDEKHKRFEPMTFCTGYLRGLSFHGNYAIVGMSKLRHSKTFSGLPLETTLKDKNAEAKCGIQVIDLRNGDIVHWLTFEGLIDELYDVITLPNVRRPMALGFVSDEIRRLVSIEE